MNSIRYCSCGANSVDSPWRKNYGMVVGNICLNCKRLTQKNKRTTVEGKIKVIAQNAAQRSTTAGRQKSNLACKSWHYAKRKTCNMHNFKDRLKSLLGMSLKRNSYSKTSRTHEILGASFEEVMQHLGCLNGIPEGYEIDHILPMALAYDETSAIKLNHYTNLQLLTKAANLEKRDKLPDGRNARDLSVEEKKELIWARSSAG